MMTHEYKSSLWYMILSEDTFFSQNITCRQKEIFFLESSSWDICLREWNFLLYAALEQGA